MPDLIRNPQSAIPNPGVPIEVAEIDRALGKLWEETGESKTRASLINLTIYTEDPQAVAENTKLIATVASDHACRAILVLGNPKATTSKIQAWINAHCHLVGKDKRQICSEQITFQLEGDAARSLPSIVFSHLDSDLPLCFWWQGEFPKMLDEQLWGWVDRLLFDSSTWKSPLDQFDRVLEIVQLGRRAKSTASRTTLCDLNWERLIHTRYALARFFDHPAALAQLKHLDKISIHYGMGHRTTAVLLLSWFANQLGWSSQPLLDKLHFTDPSGRQIEFHLEESGPHPINQCLLSSPDAEICLERSITGNHYTASMRGSAVPETSQMLPTGRDSLADIVVTELGRSGYHPLYLKAIETSKALL